jgi:hypothetical protein
MPRIRRPLLVLLLSLCLPLGARAQAGDSSSATVGTLVYFEGSVEVKAAPDGAWTSGTIEQPLRGGQSIRTGPTATAEIKWKNGTKSTLGPQTTQPVGPLYKKIASQSGDGTDGLVGKFVELFQGTSESSNDVGGIRRAAVELEETPGPGEVYWKTFEEVSFAEAQAQFRQENYAAAARKFHLFLQQHPEHTQAPKAQLGMGLSYLKLNNPGQARTAFESLVADHPDDPLAERARQILDRLSS